MKEKLIFCNSYGLKDKSFEFLRFLEDIILNFFKPHRFLKFYVVTCLKSIFFVLNYKPATSRYAKEKMDLKFGVNDRNAQYIPLKMGFNDLNRMFFVILLLVTRWKKWISKGGGV